MGTVDSNNSTLDLERTVPPQRNSRPEVPLSPDFDPDRTIAGWRVRGQSQFLVGDTILHRYELTEKLGSGAMGVVFKCRDSVSGVDYAVKMVPPELAMDDEFMEGVRKNFQLIHALKHPNIAGIDFLEQDEYGAYFLIMEYAEGINLARWIEQKRSNGGLDAPEIISVLKQVAAALDYAHEKNILHRDVKPANIMIDASGQVKVLDFGLASKVRSGMSALSIRPEKSSGTPNYMSPEQFRAQYPGPESDQYALAVMAYQMFTGHLPFELENFEMLRAAVLNDRPAELKNISSGINQAVFRALSKDPANRFSSCAKFIATMEHSPQGSALFSYSATATTKDEVQGKPREQKNFTSGEINQILSCRKQILVSVLLQHLMLISWIFFPKLLLLVICLAACVFNAISFAKMSALRKLGISVSIMSTVGGLIPAVSLMVWYPLQRNTLVR